MADPLLDQMVTLIPKMRAYALVLTRSACDADDLVQDALLRAWRFRDGFMDGTNLKAWLFRILRNQFLDSTHVRRGLVEDVDGRFAAQLITNPDQEFNLRYAELMRALLHLSDDTREALLLTVGSGFTYAEAAKLCGCPVGTMKSRVNRARQLLADHVELEPAEAAPRRPDPVN